MDMDKEFEFIDKLLEKYKGAKATYRVKDNPARQAQMDFAVMAVRMALAGSSSDYDIKINKYDDDPRSAAIIVHAKNIVFTDLKNLSRVFEFASIIEAYAHTDGTVSIGFTFHGLKEIIERVE